MARKSKMSSVKNSSSGEKWGKEDDAQSPTSSSVPSDGYDQLSGDSSFECEDEISEHTDRLEEHGEDQESSDEEKEIEHKRVEAYNSATDKVKKDRKSQKLQLASLTPEGLKEFLAKEDKKGVIYMSRVPPYMKPEKVRHLLGQYGQIGRIYLTPEDDAIRRRRMKAGGNKKVKYIDGWIEFEDKGIAKRVAATLNNTPVGNRNLGFWEHDLWTLKYLSKFKWRHLTEKKAHDAQARSARLQAEIREAKKERQFYLEQAQNSKAIQNIQKRLQKKAPEEAVKRKREMRNFKQKSVTNQPADSEIELGDSILSKVFSKKARKQ